MIGKNSHKALLLGIGFELFAIYLAQINTSAASWIGLFFAIMGLFCFYFGVFSPD